MGQSVIKKFYLYDRDSNKFLVELLFGEKVWLEEGELDSVPRTWAFTENEIIEKFGEENLKYKLAIKDYKQNKY